MMVSHMINHSIQSKSVYSIVGRRRQHERLGLQLTSESREDSQLLANVDHYNYNDLVDCTNPSPKGE